MGSKTNHYPRTSFFLGNWHRRRAEWPTLHLDCHALKAPPTPWGRPAQEVSPSCSLPAWGPRALQQGSASAHPGGSQTPGDDNKRGRKCCIATQASLGAPKIQIPFIRCGQEEGTTGVPRGTSASGKKGGGAKRLKAPSLGPGTQVGPSESSKRLRRFRGSKEGKEPRGGSESVSLRSRPSLGGREEREK